MDSVSASYIGFFTIGIAVILWKGAERMSLFVYLLGLLILPVADYARAARSLEFAQHQSPYWIFPNILPGEFVVTKGLVAAATIGCGIILRDTKTLRQFRPHWIDLPIILWCFWPLLQGAFKPTDPAGWQSTIYLLIVWLIPWLAGRLYLSTPGQRSRWIEGIILTSIVLIPLAIFETISGWRLYEMLYGHHPFATIGSERLLGTRPLLFFEDGNQYGLWMALAAALAIWRAFFARQNEQRKFWHVASVGLILTALLSQSVGAIILLLAAIGAMTSLSLIRRLLPYFRPALLIMTMLVGIYASGVIPMRSLAKETAAGQTVVSLIKRAGQGSFTWRLSQDEQTLPTIRAEMPMGAGQWDWWAPLGRRPWGLPLLLAGQFGLFGLILAFGSPAMAAAQHILRPIGEKTSNAKIAASTALPFTLVLAMVFVDMWLNAFVLPLMLVMAGALAKQNASIPGKTGRKAEPGA